MTAPSAPFDVLTLPDPWQVVEFLSDVHLHPDHPRTAQALFSHLEHTDADAVFLLGDLFEVWVGDDVLQDTQSHEWLWCERFSRIAQHRALYFLHGNRDFLFGATAAHAAGMTLLHDPTAVQWSAVADAVRLLVTHGDALCLDDKPYQAFRAMARTVDWQNQFQSLPLQQRRAAARGLRNESESHKRTATVYADIDHSAALDWLTQAQAHTLIHGHTHRPGMHWLTPAQLTAAPDQSVNVCVPCRWVLSDWEFDSAETAPDSALTVRGDVLRWERQHPARLLRQPPLSTLLSVA